jgi:hypothetical protein
MKTSSTIFSSSIPSEVTGNACAQLLRYGSKQEADLLSRQHVQPYDILRAVLLLL